MRLLVLALVFLGITAAAAPDPNGRYLATAYSQHGITASGVPVQRHIVAADPAVLPIGSRIKIRHAGRYSGEYVVADTGEKIDGRHLDIYIPDERACTKFGRKTVRVQVISLGDNTKQSAVQAEHAVKQDVKQDLAKKAVGNAATESDWAAKKNASSAPSSPSTTAAPAGTDAAK